MKNITPNIQVVLTTLVIFLFAIVLFTSCNNKPKAVEQTVATPAKAGAVLMINAIIKDNWAGTQTTEANDSLWCYTGGKLYSTGYTNAAGMVSITIPDYVLGNPVILQAVANNTICGKVYNQSLSNIAQDPSLTNPVFLINAPTTDLIPVKVVVTDLVGTPRPAYTVQFKQGSLNYGVAALTDANGAVVYGTGLAPNTTYTVTAMGSTGVSPAVTVSTTALVADGATGKKCSSIEVYIRY